MTRFSNQNVMRSKHWLFIPLAVMITSQLHAPSHQYPNLLLTSPWLLTSVSPVGDPALPSYNLPYEAPSHTNTESCRTNRVAAVCNGKASNNQPRITGQDLVTLPRSRPKPLTLGRARTIEKCPNQLDRSQTQARARNKGRVGQARSRRASSTKR